MDADPSVLAWTPVTDYRAQGAGGTDMMDREIENDENEPRGAVSALLGPMLAVVLVGGGLAMFEPVAVPARAHAVVAAPPVEISAGQYEALRDMVPVDRSLAARVLEAIASDRMIDEGEYRTLRGGIDHVASTPLDTDAAREDLMRTAEAYAQALD